MHLQLINKLHAFTAEHNPDVLISLQEQGRLAAWLEEKVQGLDLLIAQLRSEGKPGYIIEEVCMKELTAELVPSKYEYVAGIFRDEFEAQYYNLKATGVLVYETINILQRCEAVFEQFPYTEDTEDNRLLRYAIIGTIQHYLEEKV